MAGTVTTGEPDGGNSPNGKWYFLSNENPFPPGAWTDGRLQSCPHIGAHAEQAEAMRRFRLLKHAQANHAKLFAECEDAAKRHREAIKAMDAARDEVRKCCDSLIEFAGGPDLLAG